MLTFCLNVDNNPHTLELYSENKQDFYYMWNNRKIYIIKNKSCTCYTVLIYQGLSFYLKMLHKKGHNSKDIAFRVMPLVLQLDIIMMRKYSKFGVDTFNTF